MHISFDTNELTETDRYVLAVLAGKQEVGPKTEPEEKPKAAPKTEPATQPKAKPAPKTEPAVDADGDPIEDYNPLGGEEDDVPTLRSEALALASDLVANGKSKDVRALLVEMGYKKVTEVSDAGTYRRLIDGLKDL